MALSNAMWSRVKIVVIILAANVVFVVADYFVPQPKGYLPYLKAQIMGLGALVDLVLFVVALIRRNWMAAIAFLFFAALFVRLIWSAT